MRRIEVLHLVSELAHGGTERLLYDLLTRVDPDTYRMTIVTTSGADAPEVRHRFEAAGLHTHHLPLGLAAHAGRGLRGRHLLPKLAALRQLWAFLRCTRPDIVHTHGAANNFYGPLAARLGGVPHIMTHDHNPVAGGRRDRLAVNLAAGFSDIAFVASRTVGTARRALLCWRPERVVHLPNGIDVEHFRPPTAAERRRARQRFGLPADAYVAGAVGRLVPFKRHDLLVEALPLLLAEVPGAHLLLVGEGPERSALVERARRLGVGARLHLAGWQPEPVHAYWALDTLAMPSDAQEGFGLAVAEAMACGLPVVARRCPLFAEVAGDRAARLVPPAAPAIAASLAALAGSAPERDRLGAQARRHAERHFDVGLGASLLESIYSQCLAGDRRRQSAQQELLRTS